MSKSLSIALFLAFLVVTGSTVAGRLDRSIVSAKAEWVAHLDLEKLNNTEIGRMVRGHLEQTGEAAKLDAFKAVASFHPLDDIKSVTIYGRGKEQANAIAIFEAAFKKETLLSLLRFNPTFTEAAHGDHQVRSWIDDKHAGDESKRQYGSFHGENRVILGSSLEMVKHSLDVLDGKADSARGRRQFNLMRRGAQDAFLVAAANGIGKMAEQWEQTVMLKNTEQSSLIAGETEGKLFAELNLLAVSEDTARELTQVVQGIIAMLNLVGRDQPQVAELAAATKVTNRDNLVRVRVEAEIMKVAMFLKAEWDKKQQQGITN
ncbi:MAG: hypothetical protein IH624_07295 [Phycisphaerae bacterium]|nr:hypothetical protein [Phycisphaerae bacterium]